MEKKYYIAYGSNTCAEQMQQRCPDSRLIGTAMLDGFELEFRGAATIVPKCGAQTPVLIWEISDVIFHAKYKNEKSRTKQGKTEQHPKNYDI